MLRLGGGFEVVREMPRMSNQYDIQHPTQAELEWGDPRLNGRTGLSGTALFVIPSTVLCPKS